ncbi:hypothetical protein MHLP_02305 [Candidatus Mycoplasma haematolamae str. Purdue]|uniref:Uncharacterized protein n=1 Tax=Mycoplasma haematolamae (strain Purdue) TaxID=1212765 RepID=I7CFQ0_MYCHA|nr:hypothetical protein [Candidatus Mycoplasma haematolamae]AFO52041.1 hypothetical protein MHLP_02305 [Candidatus Mycoplasma haematolamae str. Purdue]
MTVSPGKVKISIEIDEELHEKLKVQLKLLKDNHIKGVENAETVEDLILFYLEQFSAGEEQMKRIEDRMQSVLDTLKERGVDVMDLFNNFSKKMQEDEKTDTKAETSQEKKKS